MKPFSASGASSYAQGIDKNWDLVDDCKVVSYTTQFNIFRELDYKECVCLSWAPGQADCINGNSANVDDSETAQITQ